VTCASVGMYTSSSFFFFFFFWSGDFLVSSLYLRTQSPVSLRRKQAAVTATALSSAVRRLGVKLANDQLLASEVHSLQKNPCLHSWNCCWLQPTLQPVGWTDSHLSQRHPRLCSRDTSVCAPRGSKHPRQGNSKCIRMGEASKVLRSAMEGENRGIQRSAC
jgi:hypothetical protein